MMDINVLKAQAELSNRQREWYDKIPHVPFDPSWDVRAVPAFGGAMVRYRVQSGKADISVYMDAYDALGCMGEPYWEMHPGADGEPDRFLLNETDDLVEGLRLSIKRLNT